MKKELGRKIINLRKKRGLSQKDAAAQLGISQALLSHYEKGIRECGLEFVVKLAQFYEVSSDYLLGLSEAEVSVEIAESEEPSDAGYVKSNTFCLLNRRLNANSIAVIYSLLAKINNKKLSKSVSEYLAVAEYSVFRYIYSIKENNTDGLFRLNGSAVDRYCSSSLALSEARIKELTENLEGLNLSSDILAQEYPESFSSLHELIKNAEKCITQNYKIS